MRKTVPSLGQLAIAAVIVSLFASCNRSHKADELVGEYVLVSVDGESLPVRIYEGDNSYQDVVGGQITLTDAGEAVLITETEVGMFGMTTPQVDSVSGTYTHGDGAITLLLPNSPPTTVRSFGDELTLHFEHVFVWKRRPS